MKSTEIDLEDDDDDNFQNNKVYHYTGKYRDLSHQGCNVNYKDSHVVPIIFHNLSGYDEEKITKKYCKNVDEFNILTRKGILPYEYVSSWEKLEEDQLPAKDSFYSKLNDSHISDGDYEHACNEWKTFNLKAIGEYSDLYLQTDVLLLADIFKNFRKTCFTTYNLDALHYM